MLLGIKDVQTQIFKFINMSVQKKIDHNGRMPDEIGNMEVLEFEIDGLS